MTQQPGGSGPDLIGEFQRWLIRSSARGMGRQVTGQIRAALGRNQQPTGDVWETATTEPPEEAPECAWCPLCRAARLLRETKPGRDTRVTAVSDALGTVVQDAFSVLEAALATTGRAASSDAKRGGPAGTARSGPAKAGPAKTGPAQTGPAGTGRGKSGPATTGQATTGPAKTGPGKPGPAGKPGAAAQRPAQGTGAEQPVSPGSTGGTTGSGPAQPVPEATGNGQAAAKRGPGDEPGPAGQGPGSDPAPDSPDGSLHEPDDRD